MKDILEIIFGDKTPPISNTFSKIINTFSTYPDTYFTLAFFILFLTIIDNGRIKILFHKLKNLFVLPDWIKIFNFTYKKIQDILDLTLKILASSGLINLPLVIFFAYLKLETNRSVFAYFFITNIYMFYLLLWVKICLHNLAKPNTDFNLLLVCIKIFDFKKHYTVLLSLWTQTKKYLITYFLVTFPLFLIFSFKNKTEIIVTYTVYGYFFLIGIYLFSFERIHRKDISNN